LLLTPRPPRPPPLVLQFSEQPLQLLLLSWPSCEQIKEIHFQTLNTETI
jgi:hypothetical protein